jgi:hypothetical protein
MSIGTSIRRGTDFCLDHKRHLLRIRDLNFAYTWSTIYSVGREKTNLADIEKVGGGDGFLRSRNSNPTPSVESGVFSFSTNVEKTSHWCVTKANHLEF